MHEREGKRHRRVGRAAGHARSVREVRRSAAGAGARSAARRPVLGSGMWGQGKASRARGLLEEGQALERQGRVGDALAAYAAASEVAPRWDLPHRAIGQAALAAGSVRVARDAFNRALALDPGSAAGYLGRSRALRGCRSFRAALADLGRALELAPREARARFSNEVEQLEFLVLLQEAPPPRAPAALDLATADARRLDELIRALDLGQVRTAGRGMRALLDRYPGHPKLLAHRALAHLALGSIAEAVDDCVSAAAGSLAEPLVRQARGEVFLALRDPEGALRELSESIDTGGDGVRCRIARARALLERGDLAATRTDLEWVLERSPDHAAALACAEEVRRAAGREERDARPRAGATGAPP